MFWHTKKNLKTKKWRHYFLRIMSGIRLTWRIIRSWSHNSFEMLESIRNNSQSKDIGCHMSWSWETRNSTVLRVNSCFNGRKGKVFCIILCPAMKSGYTMMTQSIEDHRVNLAMHQHQWQNQIFMVRRFCSAFGGITWV